MCVRTCAYVCVYVCARVPGLAAGRVGGCAMVPGSARRRRGGVGRPGVLAAGGGRGLRLGAVDGRTCRRAGRSLRGRIPGAAWRWRWEPGAERKGDAARASERMRASAKDGAG